MKLNNAEVFLNGTILYSRLMGFEYEIDNENKKPWMKLILRSLLLNKGFVLVGLLLYFFYPGIDFHAKIHTLLFSNYYLVSFANIATLVYNRKVIVNAFNLFRTTYPTKELENAYNLQTHAKQYKFIENILVVFFWSAIFFYCFQPLIGSIIHLVKYGKFTFQLPWRVWYGVEIPKENVTVYSLMYTLQAWSIYMCTIINFAMNLCIYGSMIQLNMQFDIIGKNILLIEPDNTNKATKQFIKEIVSHQEYIRLAEKLNTVFTPSILFSLFSSAVIMCFTGFQLLGDLSLIIVVKAVFLLAYELKNVAITCFLGDKLTDITFKISESIYEHKWYNGTPNYKRLILIVLMRSQQDVAFHIAGITDINLQTFRRVMSVSYQIFTLLRTS